MTNEEEIKVWVDLCEEHAMSLIDEEDYKTAICLEGPDDLDWSCRVEGCEERATVQGLVRMTPSLKKKEASA